MFMTMFLKINDEVVWERYGEGGGRFKSKKWRQAKSIQTTKNIDQSESFILIGGHLGHIRKKLDHPSSGTTGGSVVLHLWLFCFDHFMHEDQSKATAHSATSGHLRFG